MYWRRKWQLTPVFLPGESLSSSSSRYRLHICMCVCSFKNCFLKRLFSLLDWLYFFLRTVDSIFIDLFLDFLHCCIDLCVYLPVPHSLAAAAKSLQSCPTLCDPIDGSPPGSPVPGILQARTLEWVAISFSNAWKWKVKGKLLSRVWLLATPWTAAYQAPPSMGFSRQEYWNGVPITYAF